MKSLLKKLIPKSLVRLYHFFLAKLAVLYYQHPSQKMIIIGVTGTKGKSTTCFLTAKMLEGAGFKVGLSSTIMFKVAEKEWLNDKKMTMVGRFQLQRLLKAMVDAGCQYAVVETSSEGIAQYRHLGIDYDILVFTGLTPEHIEAHGSFENYKKAKLTIFKDLERRKNKRFKCQASSIKRIIIANGESEYAQDFLNFKADEKISYKLLVISYKGKEYKISNVEVGSHSISFKVDDVSFNLKLLGQFNILNSLAVISVGLSQGIELEKIKQALEKVESIPGRMEVVSDKDFKVIVDYAHEPHSMESVYKEVSTWPYDKIITVFGGTGGGRDKSKRPKMGALAADYADYIVLTTDDPYDDKVEEISNDIEKGIRLNDKWKMINDKLFKIVDRRQAIKKAISLARKNDIVLILGKGCEQKMALANGKYIDWDDREIAREILST